MRRLSRAQIVGTLVTLAVTAAVAAGMLVMGSPGEERARQLDERRVEHLAGIARAVDLYWTRHARLPASLDELGSEVGEDLIPSDPGTSASYEYRPLEGGRYEVCAQFDGDSPRPDQGARDDFWLHGTGRQCYRREPRTIG